MYSEGHIGKLAFLGVVVFPVTEQCLTLDLFFFYRLNVIFSRFDEVQRSGNMIPSSGSGRSFIFGNSKNSKSKKSFKHHSGYVYPGCF